MNFVAFLVMAAVVIAVGIISGPIAQTRVFGILWLLGAAWLVFAKEIPVSLGDVEVVRLRGWTKVFVILPALAVGVLLAVYAPEVTCWPQRRRHLCASG